LNRRDFDRVLRRGGRRRTLPELVVVTSDPGQRGRLATKGPGKDPVTSRLGITVGRKAGSSVERNRFKRRVREWFRHHRASLARPLDIVVIARRSAVDLSLEELSSRLARLLGAVESQVPENTKENSSR
jgi:ribonuclease P protein component